MATKTYIVAYPHPEVPLRHRILPFRLDLDDGGNTVLEWLCDTYLDQRDDLKDARLWKTSELATADTENSNQQICEWIKEREKYPENNIELYEAVENHFPDGPQQPSGDWIDIMVVTPEVIEDMDYPGLDENNRRMKKRLAFSRTLGRIASPYACVGGSAAVKETVLDRSGPPTALFDHALAVLQYDLEHIEALTPSETTTCHAFDLISRSTVFFDEEDGRESSLRCTLKTLLPGNSKWQRSVVDGAVKSDGIWFEGPFVYLIFKLKNEPGLGGDPFLQSLAVYGEIIKQKEYSKFCLRSNLPVVLLSMAGNRLEVSTAAFTDAVYADKLLSLDLRLGPHGHDNVLCVARVFMAMNKCMERLCELYRGIGELPKVVPRVMYPSPTADPPESTIPQLEFFSKLDRADGTPLTEVDEVNKRHGIYLAGMPGVASTGDTSTKIVLVKFTEKYNEDAHRLLANNDPPLAPTLYHCIRVIGGLYMVVMEYMPNAKNLRSFFGSSCLPPLPNAKAVRRDLTKALNLLHGQDFVFGDLRPPNILYSPEDNRAFLVDFDWVGKHKEDRYPACLSTGVDLGVYKWQIMKKSHDRVNLERVMEWLFEKLAIFLFLTQ